MKAILTFLVALIFSASAHAQIPSVAWTRSLGSTFSDAGHFIRQLPDKSFFLAANSGLADGQLGNTTGPADGGVVFIGLDSLGQMQWGQRIGPSSEHIMHGALMDDGNYVFTGSSHAAGPEVPPWEEDRDIWIVKVSPTGSIIWQHVYGMVDQDDLGLHVAARPDGGCFVTGERALSDAWVIALDSDGDELWVRTYGGSGPDFGQSIVATADGGALLAAWTGSSDGDVSMPLQGNYDGWLVKLNADGDIEWDRTYGGFSVDYFGDILPLPGGDYLVMGTSNSINGDVPDNNGDSDVWLMRLDSLGTILWSQTYGGSDYDIPRDIIPYQGNYLIAGYTSSPDGDVSVSYDPPNGQDAWLLLVDPDGELLWEKSVGGSDGDGFYDVAPTDNGFIATGVSSSADHFVPGNVAYGDVWTVRFNNKSTFLGGTLYVDEDNDEAISLDDPRIGGRLVELNSNNELALSESDGRYTFAVNGPAQHTISGPAIQHYAKDPDTHTASITGDEPAVSGFDFRYTPEALAQDLQVFLTPITPFTPGFPVRYDVMCRNVGTITINATVSLALDDGLGFDGASITPESILGNTLTWILGPMSPLQNIQFSVDCTQSVADTLGSPVTTTAEITPIAGDLVPEDNSVTTNNQVVGSYDPNDISVEPTSIDIDHLGQSTLDYLIRFQNTGTDVAWNVAIENRLPANTEWTSFEVIGSSHPITPIYYDFDHKMRFEFEWIMLPDSGSNELASHGYVRYRLRPSQTLQVGDSILNQASIYFDFNEPVITNTAVTQIVTTASMPTSALEDGFELYPNPTSGLLHLRTAHALANAEISLTDALGQIVRRGRMNGSTHVLDLSSLSPGVYSLNLNSEAGMITERLVVR